MRRRMTVTSRRAWASDPEEIALSRAPAVIDDPVLKKLLGFWIGRCRDGRLPVRADIDPLAIGPEVLPHLVLFDAVYREGRADVRYRLVGTAVVEQLGTDPTGRYLRAMMNDALHAEQLVRHVHLPVETGSPFFSEGVHLFEGAAQPERVTKRLILPLQPLTDGTALVVGAQIYHSGTRFHPTPADSPLGYRSTRFARLV